VSVSTAVRYVASQILHAASRVVADRYRLLRTTHPVSVLRWLRNGVLLCVLAAALLYLWVATAAGSDIGTANQTRQAIMDIKSADRAAMSADTALDTALTTEDVTLTGAGSLYVNDIDEVSKYLTLAAEGNAAGQEGTSGIQYVQDDLQIYLSLSENAVTDYAVPVGRRRLARAAEKYASSSNGDLTSVLKNLEVTEQAAFGGQCGAWPLDPVVFWWVLLGPVIGQVLLTMATAHVLARHFRRHLSRWLWGSLLMATATVVTVGFFNWNDERHLSADPWAGHPATMVSALLLFLLAAVLAHLAYRPRLAEYRFESS
jgi:hypothetical protein